MKWQWSKVIESIIITILILSIGWSLYSCGGYVGKTEGIIEADQEWQAWCLENGHAHIDIEGNVILHTREYILEEFRKRFHHLYDRLMDPELKLPSKEKFHWRNTI